MKVSIVSIAKNKKELEPLMNRLKKQTFKDWEFVYSTKKGIPQAWNDAFSKAKGKIIITTESDAMPLTDTWIEELVNALEKLNSTLVFVRGLEFQPTSWCWCNTVFYAETIKKHKLDKSYPIAEDTEFFSRLHYKYNYKGYTLNIAPVMHVKKFKGVWKEIKNHYLYGKLHARIKNNYHVINFNENDIKSANILKREIANIFGSIALLIGIIRGLL